MFSILSKTKINILTTFDMSSENTLNVFVVEANILSLDKELRQVRVDLCLCAQGGVGGGKKSCIRFCVSFGCDSFSR